MGKALFRYQQRKKADKRREDLIAEPSRVRFIHYSCESFKDRLDASSPRVTSIAVRDLGSGQTESFSLHLVAEREHLALPAEAKDLDRIEKLLLIDFFEYVKRHPKAFWVNWSMRNSNYGFEALAHRLRVLGGQPEQFEESRCFDLADHLVTMFGSRVATHPRLDTLRELNQISKKDFLTGAEEAEAFVKGQFHRLHQSTLRKVDVIHHLFMRLSEGTLKTEANFWQRSGATLLGVVEQVSDTWWYKVLGLIGIITSIVGFFLAL